MIAVIKNGVDNVVNLEYIYKFRKFDEKSVTALANNYFFAAPPEKMNDVFELKYKLLYDINCADKEEESINEELQMPSGQAKDESLDRIGIYSLSKSFNSPLLWALYADSGKGFVIVYDFKKIFESIKPLDFFDISYIVDDADIAFKGTESIYEKIFSRKHKSFKYEDECRFIFDPKYHDKALNISNIEVIPDALRKITYDRGCIKEIIFGWAMDSETKELIKTIFHNDNVVFTDAKFGLASYNIVKV